jgi:hypothetical protein
MKLNKTRLLSAGFANALGVLLYTLAVAWLMENLGKFYDSGGPAVLQIAAFLMLLVLSVAVVGLLLFGWPILLYLQGQRKVAVFLEITTIGSLFLLTALALIVNVVL